MQPTREQLYDCLVSLGVTPTIQQISDLLKISKRYYRNMSVQVTKGMRLEALIDTYTQLKNDDVAVKPLNTLSIVTLALNGFQSDASDEVKQESIGKAQLHINEKIKSGRPHDTAKKILASNLCLYYNELFDKLPPCRYSEDKGQYEGKGLFFVLGVWHVIAGDNIKGDSLGRYLIDEKKRIKKIWKDENK